MTCFKHETSNSRGQLKHMKNKILFAKILNVSNKVKVGNIVYN